MVIMLISMMMVMMMMTIKTFILTKMRNNDDFNEE